MKSFKSIIFILIIGVFLLNSCKDESQLDNPTGSESTAAQSFISSREARLEWWREAKFGIFVHWGPCTVSGTEISWGRDSIRKNPYFENPPADVGNTGIFKKELPAYIYDNLYKRFNPVDFNSDKMVDFFQEIGAKYLVFVTKHHDGFCNFDTKYSDYKITSPLSPYKKDIFGQIANSAHKKGMRLGFYYSPVDWYYPDIYTSSHSNYVQMVLNQIYELTHNYGKIDICWLDGGAPTNFFDSKKILEIVSSANPNIVVNNRCEIEGDFNTPEGYLGAYSNGRAWELAFGCAPYWSWRPNLPYFSISVLKTWFAKTIGNGGNILINLQPDANGNFDAKLMENMRELGKWVKKNDAAIYGSKGGPFLLGNWGTSSYKGNSIYLFVFNTKDGSITLPKLNASILSCSILNGEKLEFSNNSKLIIKVSDQDLDDEVSVIELKISENPKYILPMKAE